MYKRGEFELSNDVQNELAEPEGGASTSGAADKKMQEKRMQAMRQTSKGFYEAPMDTIETRGSASASGSPVMSCIKYNPLDDKHDVSSGNPIIISGCKDGTIVVSDYSTLEVMNEYKAHADAVMCLQVYQPPGEALLCVVSGSKDNTIKISIALSGEEVGELVGHTEGVWSLDILHQQNKEPLIVSGSLDGTIGIWSILEKKQLRIIKSNGGSVLKTKIFASASTLESLKYASENVDTFDMEKELMVLGACEDRVLRMWSLQTGKLIQKFEGFPQRITDVTFFIPENFNLFEKIPVTKSDNIKKSSVINILFFEQAKHIWSVVRGVFFAFYQFIKLIVSFGMNKYDEDEVREKKWRGFEFAKDNDLDIIKKEAVIVASCLDGKIRIYLAKSGHLIRTLFETNDAPSEVRPSSYTVDMFYLKKPKDSLANKTQNLDSSDGESANIFSNPLHAGLAGLNQLRSGTNRMFKGFLGESDESENIQEDVEPQVIAGYKNGTIICWDISTGIIWTKKKLVGCAISSLSVSSSLDPINTFDPPIVKDSIYSNAPIPPESVNIMISGSQDSNKIDDYGDRNAHPIILIVGVDGSIVKKHFNCNSEECLRAYENDKLFKVPRNIITEVPREFAKFPRMYLLCHNHGTIDSYFSGEIFNIFFVALHEENDEFIKVFLPYAKSGLLMSSRKKLRVNLLHRKIREKTQFDIDYPTKHASIGSMVYHYLKKPWEIFSSVIPNFDTKIDVSKKSLLLSAIDSHNAVSIRLILAVWIQIIDVSPADLLDQSAGPATSLDNSDLYQLASTFPNEFEWFLCNIKPIKSNSVLQKRCNFHMNQTYKRENSHSRGKLIEDVSIWRIEKSSLGLEEELTCFFLPLSNPTDLQLLRCIVGVCSKLNSIKILESDFGNTIVSYSWSAYGRNQHIASFLFYTYTVSMFTLFLTTGIKAQAGLAHIPYTHTLINEFTSSAAGFLIIVGSFTSIFTQYQKQLFENISILKFLSRGWNLIDVFTMGAQIYCILTARDTDLSDDDFRIALSCTSLLSFLRVLYFFRSFQSTGTLVALLFEIGQDLGFYIAIMFTIIFGFGETLWMIQGSFPLITHIMDGDDDGNDVVSNPRSDRPANSFGTLRESVLKVYDLSFNGIDTSQFRNTSDPLLQISIIMAVIASFFISIIILNMLIAYISDVYAKMSSRGNAQLQLNQLKTMVETALITHQRYNNPESVSLIEPRFIHFVRRNKDLDFEALQNDLNKDQSERIIEEISELNDKTVSVINDIALKGRYRLNETSKLLQTISGNFSKLVDSEKNKKRIAKSSTVRK